MIKCFPIDFHSCGTKQSFLGSRTRHSKCVLYIRTAVDCYYEGSITMNEQIYMNGLSGQVGELKLQLIETICRSSSFSIIVK